ncbi:MAG: hypothetical protein O6761_03475 [Thaumarchaeota archaeon]|nr:hypothetical protein [Nitrososphaerota archaeon]
MIFFLSTVLLFQTVTFSPIALAQSSNEDTNVPSWFKNNVKWWKEDKISDRDIINAIENLLKREIIKLDSTKIKSEVTLSESRFVLPPYKDGVSIPSHVKNTFASWEEGVFSDSDVANTIKFLIKANVIITSTSSPDKPRQLAAIIDQLDDLVPNKAFQQKAQEYLENAGYDVDVYTTEDITVDFYKKLPSMNYKFIYIRTHSFEIPRDDNNTYLFTGEKYDINKYIQEQLFDQVSEGMPIYGEELMQPQESNELVEDQTYFVVGSKLVDELMVGEFPQTLIVIGGCESVRKHDLAKSLIIRGASAVVGWDRSIGSMENDLVMIALFEEILINKINISDSIVSVMEKFGPGLQYSSELHYFHT